MPLSDKNNHVPAVFIDVSETGDDGRQLWDELSHESWASSTPIIAICKEGNLTQIRNAILSDLINDLIFEPIDVESIKETYQKTSNPVKKQRSDVTYHSSDHCFSFIRFLYLNYFFI